MPSDEIDFKERFENLDYSFRSENYLLKDSLQETTEYIELILEGKSSWPEDIQLYFLNQAVPSYVTHLLKRSDLHDELVDAAASFLRTALRLIIHFFPSDQHCPLLATLAFIFDCYGQTFYRLFPTFLTNPPAGAEKGSDPLTSRVFTSEPEEEKEDASGSIPTTPLSDYARANLETFGSLLGFELLADRLKSPDVSVVAIKTLLRPVILIREILRPSFYTPYADALFEALTRRLLSLDEASLKGIEKNDLDIVIYDLEFLRFPCPPEAYPEHSHFFDTFRLDFAHRYFTASSLKMRLHGLADIKKFCEQITEKEFHLLQQQQQQQQQPDQYFHPHPSLRLWLTPQYLCNWIRDKEILTRLFVHNVHIELVRRSPDLLKFMATYHHLTDDDIKLSWNCAENQHESLVRVVRQNIADLCPSLSLPQLDLVAKLLHTIPFRMYNNQIISLVRSCTIQSVLKSADLPVSEKKYYGLPIMWDFLQDDSNVSTDMLFQALHFMLDFLNWNQCHPERLKYAVLCIDNLKASRSQTQSLRVLKKIFETYPLVPPEADPEAALLSTMIARIDAEHQLLAAIFDDLPIWKRNSKTQALVQFPQLDIHTNNLAISGTILSGRYTHADNVKERLTFLTYLLAHSSLELCATQLATFWQCFVMEPLSSGELDEAFLWLEGAKYPTRAYQSFSDAAARDLFSIYVPSLDLTALRLRGYAFIKFYFLWINFSNGHLDKLDTAGGFSILSLDLIGLDVLWEIVFTVRDQTVGTHATSFLLDLHRKLAPNLKDGMLHHRESYINRCFDQFHMAPETPGHHLRIKRAILVLRGLMDQFEPSSASSRSSHQSFAPSLPNSQLLLTIKHVLSGMHFQESFPATATFQEVLERTQRSWPAVEPSPAQCNVHLYYHGRLVCNKNATLSEACIRTKTVLSLAFTSDPPVVTPAPDELGFTSQQCASVRFHELFALLAGDPKIAADIWSLLMKLPTNPDIAASLQAGGAWSQLLSADEGPFMLLYRLQIIEKLVAILPYDTPALIAEKVQWRLAFLRDRGLSHLLRVLCQVELEVAPDSKFIDCLSLILKSIVALAVDVSNPEFPLLSQQLVIDEDVDLPQVVSKIMAIVQYRSDQAAAPPQPPPRPASLPSGPGRQPPPLPLSKSTQTSGSLIVQESITLLLALLLSVPSLLTHFLEHPALDEWIQKGLLLSPAPQCRTQIQRCLVTLASHQRATTVPFLLYDKLWRIIDNHTSLPQGTCQQYFEFFNAIIEFAAHNPAGPAHFPQLLARLIQIILTLPVIECNTDLQIIDRLLIGCLNLVASLVRHGIYSEEVLTQLLPHIFYQGLFSIPERGKPASSLLPKAKRVLTREAAFQCLLQISYSRPETQPTIHALLLNQLRHLSSRDTPRTNYEYDPSEFLKASCGFVGLYNLGTTCYINSLMQQFFFVPEFRTGILTVRDPETDRAQSLLWQFQTMLSHLIASDRRYFDMRPFVGSYRVDGQPINPFIQQDADEFLNMFMDKLEQAIGATDKPSLIHDVFAGKLYHQIISKECDHSSKREENFLTLSLEVKNKKNLAESLELFIQGDILDGENKYSCEQCGKGVTALKRASIGTLPNYLIIHLKRFEFDFETFERKKLNDLCEFPLSIDMTPYTLDGIEGVVPPGTNNEYELTGIVVHHGSSEAGHYYSYVRNQDPSCEGVQWISCNDMRVDLFNPEHIAAETFGGTETRSWFDAASGREVSRVIQKMYSAYILFYKRKSDPIPAASPSSLQQAQSLIPEQIYEDIWSDNTFLHEDLQVFDPNYIDFCSKLSQQPLYENNPDYTIQTMTFLLCEVLLYYTKQEHLTEFVTHLSSLYAKSPNSCHQFLTQLITTHTHWLHQFLFKCTQTSSREAFSSLIVAVLNVLQPLQAPSYSPEIPLIAPAAAAPFNPPLAEGVEPTDFFAPYYEKPASEEASGASILQFMDHLFHMIPAAMHHWKSFDAFFAIFVEFARLGITERRWLHARHTIALMIDLYLGSASPYYNSRQATHPEVGEKKSAVDQLVELVSILARRCPTLSSADHPTPYQIVEETPGQFSALDLELLMTPAYYSKALRQGIKNVDAVIDTALHLCWNDQHFSKLLVNEVLQAFYLQPHTGFHPFFQFFTAFFAIDDSFQSWRLDYGLGNFIQVVKALLGKFPTSAQLSIDYLSESARQSPLIRNWLFESRETYVDAFLITCTYTEVREASETLLYAFAPSIPPPSLTEYKPDQPPVVPQEHDLQVLQALLSMLLRLLPVCQEYTIGIAPENADPAQGFPSSFFHLISYFRILRWCVRTSEDCDLVAEYFDKFVELYTFIDEHRHECDENKKELIIFWVQLLELSPFMIDLTAANPSAVHHLLTCHISLHPNSQAPDNHTHYNQMALPSFFHLLALLAKQSHHFAEIASTHENIFWAFSSFYLSSEYPFVANALFELLSHLASSFPNFRQQMIPKALSRGIAHTNIIRLLEELVRSEEDLQVFRAQEGMLQLSQFVGNQQQYLEQLSDDPSLVPLIQGVCQAIDHALLLLARSARLLPLSEEDLASCWDHDSRFNLLFALLPLLDQPHLTSRSESLLDVLFLLCSLDPLSLSQTLQCILKNYQENKPLPSAAWALSLLKLALSQQVEDTIEYLSVIVRFHPKESASILCEILSTRQDLLSDPQTSIFFPPLFISLVSKKDNFDDDHIVTALRLMLAISLPNNETVISQLVSKHIDSIISKIKGAAEHGPNAKLLIIHHAGFDVIRLTKFINLFTADDSESASFVTIPLMPLITQLLSVLDEPESKEILSSFEQCISLQQAIASLQLLLCE